MQQTFSWECRPRFSYSYQKEWIGQMIDTSKSWSMKNIKRSKRSILPVEQSENVLSEQWNKLQISVVSCGQQQAQATKYQSFPHELLKELINLFPTVVHVHGLQSTKRQQLWFHAAAQHLTACDFTNSDAMSKAWMKQTEAEKPAFFVYQDCSGLHLYSPLPTHLHPSALWFFLEISTCFYHLPSGYLT